MKKTSLEKASITFIGYILPKDIVSCGLDGTLKLAGANKWQVSLQEHGNIGGGVKVDTLAFGCFLLNNTQFVGGISSISDHDVLKKNLTKHRVYQ